MLRVFADPRARSRRTLIALLLLLPGAVVSAQSTRTPAAQPAAGTRQAPDALAQALQQRYQTIKDFSADFSQTYRGGVLRTRTARRHGAVKKPGQMRWVYLKPEKKEFVSDGRKIYSYIPQDRQVIVSDAETATAHDAGALPGRQGRHRPGLHRRVRRSARCRDRRHSS